MADLNEWRLVYPGCDMTFGTLASDYPFATQVDVGEIGVTDEDSPHPNSDGVVMGIDSLAGMSLTFDITTVPEFPPPDKPWVNPMDLSSSFIAKWRANSVRRVAGSYATLINVDRNRLVYGRPRKCRPILARARKGQVAMVALFETNSPDFYSATEKVALLNRSAPSGAGFSLPLKPPFSSAAENATLATTNNDGDTPAWPVIQFHGPGTGFSLECFSGTTVVWKMIADGALKNSETLLVDTRPWSRSATLNGKPANGRIRGDMLDQCQIPVGDFNLRFRVKDRTGQAFADVKWRDAFASL